LGGFEIGREMELEREVLFSPLHIAEREGTTGIASVCAIFFSVYQDFVFLQFLVTCKTERL
jgi:hypothetical protein